MDNRDERNGSMTLSFEGRVALITGAGKGLGRAYALWLAARGALVVVNNRVHEDKPSSAQAVVAEIHAAGGKAVADEHAVETEAGGRAMVGTALRTWGRIDIVVCNAGVTDYAAYDALSAANFQRLMDINFWGSAYPVMAALPQMAKAGYGRVITTVSTAGLFGQARSAYYGASRSALIGFVRSLAIDAEADGKDIRLNMISPAGYTDMARAHIDPKFEDFMSPAKVAPVVGWLASERCQRSGLILHAGCGRARRVQVVGAPRIEIPGEDVDACWPALDDMAGAQEFSHSFAAGKSMNPEIYEGL
jgi:NAD(P)-dependent dehydrogenase (short-subunit alcohol dehydrogenase family)